MPTVTIDGRRTTRVLVVIVGAMVANGCASDRRAGGRFAPGTNSSTVAPDRAQFPRGTVIPPAGFGVDLVDAHSSSGAGTQAAAVTLASHTEERGERP